MLLKFKCKCYFNKVGYNISFYHCSKGIVFCTPNTNPISLELEQHLLLFGKLNVLFGSPSFNKLTITEERDL